LYGLLGTTYGAAGKLPDLRGYFVRGSGLNDDGTTSGTFGAKQADELQSHTHTMYIHPATGSGTNTNSARFSNLGLGSATTQATGGSETRPKNIAMLYCIKI
jgi:microcystin-dependent protein